MVGITRAQVITDEKAEERLSMTPNPCHLAGQDGLKQMDPKVRIVRWLAGWVGWAKAI